MYNFAFCKLIYTLIILHSQNLKIVINITVVCHPLYSVFSTCRYVFLFIQTGVMAAEGDGGSGS